MPKIKEKNPDKILYFYWEHQATYSTSYLKLHNTHNELICCFSITGSTDV